MANPLDLTGKTILITGGCGAIGRIVVRALAEYGACVAVNDVVEEAEAVRALAPAHPKMRYFRADATDAGEVSQMFDRVRAEMALPNVVCCHAGIVDAYPVDLYPLKKFDQLMQVNLHSAFVVAQRAAKLWLTSRTSGHLIFTSSWVQDVPWPEITPYTASKAGMRALARGFARELAPRGIRANIIAPGIVAVGLAKRQWDTDPSYRARAEKAIPLGFMQPPESVANAFVFLCSEMASYMTGSVLLVDGGCSLYPMD